MNRITPGNRISAALCALLFSSIMVLSAVEPGRSEQASAPHDRLAAKVATSASPFLILA